MSDKSQLLAQLIDEFNRWQDLLCSLPESDLTARRMPSDLSIKDIVAHLWAWQQRSVARFEAALEDHEPVYPGWPQDFEPEPDDLTEQVNAWIHETNLDRSWWDVYRDWRNGYQRLIALGEAIPEEDLMQVGKYFWLPGHPLAAVLAGSYDHHLNEHRLPLEEWLRQNG